MSRVWPTLGWGTCRFHDRIVWVSVAGHRGAGGGCAGLWFGPCGLAAECRCGWRAWPSGVALGLEGVNEHVVAAGLAGAVVLVRDNFALDERLEHDESFGEVP